MIALEIAAVLTVTVVALLAVPVHLSVHAARGNEWAWLFELRWLFGLVRIERTSPAKARARATSQRHTEPRGVKRRGRRRERAPGPPAFLRELAFWRRALAALRASSRGIKLRRLDADVHVGLDDPADTGLLFGVANPLVAVLRASIPGRLAIEPDFVSTTLRGTAAGRLRIVPLAVFVPVIGLGLWLAIHMLRARRASP